MSPIFPCLPHQKTLGYCSCWDNQALKQSRHRVSMRKELFSNWRRYMRLALNFSLILNDHWKLWFPSRIKTFKFFCSSGVTHTHTVALPYCQVTPKQIHELVQYTCAITAVSQTGTKRKGHFPDRIYHFKYIWFLIQNNLQVSVQNHFFLCSSLAKDEQRNGWKELWWWFVNNFD